MAGSFDDFWVFGSVSRSHQSSLHFNFREAPPCIVNPYNRPANSVTSSVFGLPSKLDEMAMRGDSPILHVVAANRCISLRRCSELTKVQMSMPYLELDVSFLER